MSGMSYKLFANFSPVFTGPQPYSHAAVLNYIREDITSLKPRSFDTEQCIQPTSIKYIVTEVNYEPLNHTYTFTGNYKHIGCGWTHFITGLCANVWDLPRPKTEVEQSKPQEKVKEMTRDEIVKNIVEKIKTNCSSFSRKDVLEKFGIEREIDGTNIKFLITDVEVFTVTGIIWLHGKFKRPNEDWTGFASSSLRANDKPTTAEDKAVRSRDADGCAFHLISPIALLRLAHTYREGSNKYADYNWTKGFPPGECLNHALRHIFYYLAGDRSEDHLAHAAWNLFTVMHFEHTNPDLKLHQYGTSEQIKAILDSIKLPEVKKHGDSREPDAVPV